jgi:hypothetical protein
MKQTHGSKYVPGYDLFKLIVAVILTLILIALLVRGRQLESSPVIYTVTVSSPTAMENTITPLSNVTETLKPVTLTAEPSATAISPTTTPVPLPTSTPTPEPTATPTPEPTSASNTCPSASSRIQIGDKIHVLVRLNFRTGPGLNWPIILTNNPGITLEVIGGPVCVLVDTSRGPRSYLWWNVRMQNGQEGWSAEAPLINPYYFLEPIR